MKFLFIILFFHSCTTATIDSQGKRPTKADTLAFKAVALSYTSDLAKLQKTVDGMKIQISELQKSQKKDSTNILALNKTITTQAAEIKSLKDSSVFISADLKLDKTTRVLTIPELQLMKTRLTKLELKP